MARSCRVVEFVDAAFHFFNDFEYNKNYTHNLSFIAALNQPFVYKNNFEKFTINRRKQIQGPSNEPQIYRNKKMRQNWGENEEIMRVLFINRDEEWGGWKNEKY